MRGEGGELNGDFAGFELLASFIFVAAAQTFNTGLDLLLVPRGQALSSSQCSEGAYLAVAAIATVSAAGKHTQRPWI